MKIIIQLLIAFLILNACFQSGRSAWNYYEFKDSLDREVLLGKETKASQMHSRIIELAAERDIILEPADVTVGRRGEETVISATYYNEIPLVPGFYKYVMKYEPTASARRVRHLVDDIR
jgi:hypothetical protein